MDGVRIEIWHINNATGARKRRLFVNYEETPKGERPEDHARDMLVKAIVKLTPADRMKLRLRGSD